MRFRVLTCALACAALFLTMGMAWGDLTPEQSAQARTLIGQLTSPELRVRQDANTRLVAMDEDVIPLLKSAMAEAKDDDARLRCQIVIDTINDPRWINSAGETISGLVAKEDYANASMMIARSLDTLIREPLKNTANRTEVGAAALKAWKGLSGGDMRKARNCVEAGYERAMRLDPEEIELYGVLLDFYAQDGNVDKGNALLMKGLAMFPSADPNWVLGGLAGAGEAGRTRTVQGCQAALEKTPGDMVSRMRLIALLQSEGKTLEAAGKKDESAQKYEEAAGQYAQIIEGANDSAVKFTLYSQQGKLYEQAKKYAEAAAALDKATAEKASAKDMASLLYHEARIKFRLGDPEGVISTWDKAIAVQPDVESACGWRVMLAKYCVEQGKIEKAMSLCDEVLNLSKSPSTRKSAQDIRQSGGK